MNDLELCEKKVTRNDHFTILCYARTNKTLLALTCRLSRIDKESLTFAVLRSDPAIDMFNGIRQTLA